MVMKGRWVWDRAQHRLVPSDEYHARLSQERAVSDLPCPMVISDQIEVQSQVDGKIYTSKAALRKSYIHNDTGYRFVEVGNEYLKNPPKPKEPKTDRKAIRESVAKAMSKVGL